VRQDRAVFFSLASWQLALVVFAVIGGACAIGVVCGHYLRKHSETIREPIGIVQGAMLGVVGMILAFGLSLAVGRYESRRGDVVAEANAIGTAYLRAQTIQEPQRSSSLALFRTYNDLSIRITREVPGSSSLKATAAAQSRLQQDLWRLVGQSLNAHPQDSAQRLYLDSLNDMFDQQTVRLSALNNRVPGPVLALEVIGAAAALGLLALHISLLGRGLAPLLVAAALISALLLITFDLDRPTRGLITVPNTALIDVRASMALPPAAGP
jgi:hypothetical protein